MKKILITGGSGSVGLSFVENNYYKYQIHSYSRNEKSQVALKRMFPEVNIILGSVEDRFSLQNAIKKINPDIIIHAAALKHVDSAEKQPIEMVKSNIMGSKNIIELSIENRVPFTIGVSTDKACNPNNLYGYSKKIMESMFLEANNSKTLFCCSRFGNVAGSNGSVIPFWLNQNKQGKALSLTDTRMKRLMMGKNEVSKIIEKCISECEKNNGGFILSKKMKSVLIYDLAKLISDDIEVIGLREGEELNENLISMEELKFTRVEEDFIFIERDINSNSNSRLQTPLSSDNSTLMTQEEMIKMINNIKNDIVNNFKY